MKLERSVRARLVFAVRRTARLVVQPMDKTVEEALDDETWRAFSSGTYAPVNVVTAEAVWETIHSGLFMVGLRD